MTRQSDKDLFHLLKAELFTAVVGDVLDVMGLQKQFLPPGIVPLKDEMKIAGRAMPVLEADYFGGGGQGPLTDKAFGLVFEALDSLTEGDVYIASGASFQYALWGGLMATRATHLKAAGAVLDGYVRDGHEIERLGFPTFSRGRYAQDQGVRGKVVDYNVPLQIDGVRIEPGDLIFGDLEGVLVIPRRAEKEAIERALEKSRTENQVAEAIKAGMSTVEAYATFGVM